MPPGLPSPAAVNQVLMSQDGQTVVTVSKDTTARVWDATTGACRHVLAGHSDAVLGGCINDAARLLATYSFDDCVRLWSLDSGQCVNCVRLPDTPQVRAPPPLPAPHTAHVALPKLPSLTRPSQQQTVAPAVSHARHPEPPYTYTLLATSQHVALSPDGWKVAVALGNSSVCVFDVEERQPGRPWEVSSPASPCPLPSLPAVAVATAAKLSRAHYRGLCDL